jgi:hypothetical protein
MPSSPILWGPVVNDVGTSFCPTDSLLIFALPFRFFSAEASTGDRGRAGAYISYLYHKETIVCRTEISHVGKEQS